MNHKKNTRKLKRTEEERRRLKIDLSRALIKSGQITTFTTRAKWFRRFFERLVTLVKRSKTTQEAYRKVSRFLDEDTARTLIEKVVPKLVNRNGGYTSLLHYKTPYNSHDKSIVTIVE